MIFIAMRLHIGALGGLHEKTKKAGGPEGTSRRLQEGSSRSSGDLRSQLGVTLALAPSRLSEKSSSRASLFL